ncbi:MAG: sigma-70 family RNA polymerase sigma factor [bacterium]|nr:sigma-70 family RNA polymerase sigma factor [bacterium]
MNPPDPLKNQNSRRLTEHVFRREYAKLVALLTNRFGPVHLESIEEAVQEAFVAALRVWDYRGVPANAVAWLHTVARNKLRNILRRDQRLVSDDDAQALESFADAPGPVSSAGAAAEEIQDSLLRMMFVCCHPRLSGESQAALILKTLCGFSVAEIAAALLSAETAIQKRLVRARKTMRDAALTMELPPAAELPARLAGVLTALYLLFNEGYKSNRPPPPDFGSVVDPGFNPESESEPGSESGSEYDLTAHSRSILIRREICEEAIGLLEVLLQSETFRDDPEVLACGALFELNAARFTARQDEHGEILRMADQDRGLWDRERIERGIAYLERASVAGSVSRYHIQAAISAHHCAAPDFSATDWPAILALYDAWLALEDSPLLRLNRAVAVARVRGAEQAIAELGDLSEEPALREYYLYDATLGELCFEAKRFEQARAHFAAAIRRAPALVERRLLRRRMAECAAANP